MKFVVKSNFQDLLVPLYKSLLIFSNHSMELLKAINNTRYISYRCNQGWLYHNIESVKYVHIIQNKLWRDKCRICLEKNFRCWLYMAFEVIVGNVEI